MFEGITGYLHPSYAESLIEFGMPCQLPNSGAWILQRQIPDFSYKDGMGCYPLFMCKDWSRLPTDLEDLENRLISLAIVTDPFGAYDLIYLQECFKDVVLPFKEHFIIDLIHPLNTFVSSHHRRNARKALQEVNIEKCQDPTLFTDDWLNLYAELRDRHKVKGISRFSKLALTKQLAVPGMVAFRAMYEKKTVGMLLWYVQGQVAYYHLGASSTFGYQLRVSFALFWFVINHFLATDGIKYLDLGAGAGVEENSRDGLSRFKRGWSTGTRTAYFCGRIFDCSSYSEIVQTKGLHETNYFPAYRQGEFG